MLAYSDARQRMVDSQLRTNDVTNPVLLGALQRIPREQFAPAETRELAYMDLDLPVTDAAPGRPARYLLKPLVLGKLIETADVQPTDRVLDVGCATGYSSAVLASLVARVVALEEDAALARTAAETLAALGLDNVIVRTGPLTAGVPDEAPFDVILLNGAVEVVPEALCRQLADGGRLVCVLRIGPVGKGMVYRASAGHVSGRAAFEATAPLLPGFRKPAAFVF